MHKYVKLLVNNITGPDIGSLYVFYNNSYWLYTSNKHPVSLMTRDVSLYNRYVNIFYSRKRLAVSASMAVPIGRARSSRSNLG